MRRPILQRAPGESHATGGSLGIVWVAPPGCVISLRNASWMPPIARRRERWGAATAAADGGGSLGSPYIGRTIGCEPASVQGVSDPPMGLVGALQAVAPGGNGGGRPPVACLLAITIPGMRRTKQARTLGGGHRCRRWRRQPGQPLQGRVGDTSYAREPVSVHGASHPPTGPARIPRDRREPGNRVGRAATAAADGGGSLGSPYTGRASRASRRTCMRCPILQRAV